MVKYLLVSYGHEVGGPPPGGLKKEDILEILEKHPHKVRQAEEATKKLRGWVTFKVKKQSPRAGCFGCVHNLDEVGRRLY